MGSRRPVWLARLASRAGQLLLVTVCVALVTFTLIHLIPGDPASAYLGTHATPEALKALRHQMGLDQPLGRQFVDFVRDTLHGDLGRSLSQQGRPVSDIILPDLLVSLSVIAAGVVFSLLIGIPLGIAAAVSKRIDSATRVANVILLSMPTFFVGLLLLMLVALKLSIAPAGGWAGHWPANLRDVWLPGIALSAYLAPIVARTVRQAAGAAMAESFVESAVARGIPYGRVVRRHVVPNSLLPVVTLVGFNIGALIAGTVVLETVFALPGVGYDLVAAVEQRDYPVIQGIALVSGVLVVFISFVTDVVYTLVDPRTRVGR